MSQARLSNLLVRLSVLAACATPLASRHHDLSAQSAPVEAQAAIISAALSELIWPYAGSADTTPVCVALIRRGPSPRDFKERIAPSFTTLIDPAPGAVIARVREFRLFAWSACQVDSVTEGGERVAIGASLRATRARARTLWLRDPELTTYLIAQAEVGFAHYGSRYTVTGGQCLARRTKQGFSNTFRPGGCSILWQA